MNTDKYKGNNFKKLFDFAFGLFLSLLAVFIMSKVTQHTGIPLIVYFILMLFVSIVIKRIYIFRGIIAFFIIVFTIAFLIYKFPNFFNYKSANSFIPKRKDSNEVIYDPKTKIMSSEKFEFGWWIESPSKQVWFQILPLDSAKPSLPGVTTISSSKTILEKSNKKTSNHINAETGKWIALTPIDGSYDSSYEEFIVVISGLPDGIYTAYEASKDEVWNEDFYFDRTPPVIHGLWPTDLISDTCVCITVDASDNLAWGGCEYVYVIVKDTEGNIMAEGKAGDCPGDSPCCEFSLNIVKPGKYTYSCTVTDSVGNKVTGSQNFILETTPPEIIKVFPPNGFITNKKDQYISARISDSSGLDTSDIVIELNEDYKKVDINIYDSFSVEIKYQPKEPELLKEGENKWRIIGKDLAGNDIPYDEHILIVDTR